MSRWVLETSMPTKTECCTMALLPGLWCGRKPDQPFGVKGSRQGLARPRLSKPARKTASCLHQPGCASRLMQISKPHFLHTSPRVTIQLGLDALKAVHIELESRPHRHPPP